MNLFENISFKKSSFFKVFKYPFFHDFKKDIIFKDFKGQLSMEYLLISFLAILILVSITLPLANFGIDLSLDSLNSLEVKSEVSKIANGIDSVYSNGLGSRRTISIQVPNDINVKFSKVTNSDMGVATVDYVLRDGSMKKIEVSYKYPYLNQDLHLIKGYNTIIIDWPINSTEIIVYKSN